MAKEKQDITDILGQGKDPAVATPSGEDDQEENPLEKMDKISKEKEKKDSGSKSLDTDVLTEMLKTGENTDGMFTPEEQGEHEDEAEEAKVKIGKNTEPSEKYKKEFKDDLLKHPDQYKVVTPKGEMTIAEAIRKGYDPLTKTFRSEHDQEKIKEKHLSKLNDADRAALEKFTSPSNAQVAPADAEMYGLQPDSPMVKQPQPNPMEQNPMMGGPAPAMQGTPSQVGNAMPGAEESQAPGGVDLSSLLGGGQ